MKIAFIFLAIVGFVTATEVPETFASRSISTVAESAIESLRDGMPCGFPNLGIPPLAPLKITHQAVNIDTEAIKLQGVFDNLCLNGLNDFDIEEIKINMISSKVNFHFIFHNVNVDTDYDLNLILKKAGFTINVIGNGPAKFAIKDLDIKGTVKYSIGILSGKLKVKTFNIVTKIGEVESEILGILGKSDINEKMNDVLTEVVPLVVNENADLLTETIETITLPIINDVLSDMTISDLIAKIGGGEEKEECIPPTY